MMQVVVTSVAYGLVAAASLAASAGIALVLYRSSAGWRAAVGAVGFLAAWYGLVIGLESSGVFGSTAGLPVFGAVFALPMVAALIALWSAPPLRRLVADAASGPALVGLQVYRVAGAAMLLLLAIGHLPALFAVPAGVGDVLVGALALPAAAALRAGRPGRALAWNALGLLDLAVAVSLGIALSPGVALITTTPDTAAMATTPMIVVPAFAVPVSVWLHVASLRSLWARRAERIAAAPSRIAAARNP